MPADLVALSRALEPPRDYIPPPRFERLFPYQQAAIHQAPLRRHLLFAHAPGLGKTPMALAVLAQKTLIVCPPTIVQQWAARMKDWIGEDAQVLTTGRAVAGLGTIRRPTIIGDSLIHHLIPMACDVLIADEVHRFKNRETRRCRAVFSRHAETKIPGIAHRAGKIVALTGTPLQNSPVDLYPLLAIAAPEVARSFKEFTERYCPPVSVNVPGSPWPVLRYDLKMQNLDELAQRLRASVMIRPDAEACQAQLPGLIEDEFRLSIVDPVSNVTEEQIVAAFDGAPASEAQIVAIAAARRLTGLAKAHSTSLTSWIADLIEGGDKPLLWCWHQEVASSLASKLDLGLIHGGVPMPQRAEIVRKYAAGELAGIAITIAAAGTGLDGLQHGGRLCVFVEQSYVPGDNDQAIARLYRVGQTRGVRVIRVRSATVVDKSVEAVLRRKSAMLKETLS